MPLIDCTYYTKSYLPLLHVHCVTFFSKDLLEFLVANKNKYPKSMQ